MKLNYLVSVFVDDKNVNSYFSENLDDLITIKALHKDCYISIFDFENFVRYTPEQVECEIIKSGKRWKESLEKPNVEETIPQQQKEKPKKEKRKKYWERPVLCVETGQVFCSIRECCERLGISNKSLWNAINSGNARNGLHFVNAPKP